MGSRSVQMGNDDLPSPQLQLEPMQHLHPAEAETEESCYRELKYVGFIEVAEGMVVRCVVRMYELVAAQWWRVYALQKKLLEAAGKAREKQHSILVFVDDKVEALVGLVLSAVRGAWPAALAAALAAARHAPDLVADIQKLGILETARLWGPGLVEACAIHFHLPIFFLSNNKDHA